MNQFTKILQHLLVFQTHWQDGNLKAYQMIKINVTVNHSLSSKLVWMNNSRKILRFKGSCLIEDKVTFILNNLINLFIIYKLDRWSHDLNADFAPKGCLFGTVKLTKNASSDSILLFKIWYWIWFSSTVFIFSLWLEAKMLLFLELMIVLPYILIIRKKISYFLKKVQHKD